jgi:hypothetical protein
MNLKHEILIMALIVTTAVSVVVTGYLISKWKGKK